MRSVNKVGYSFGVTILHHFDENRRDTIMGSGMPKLYINLVYPG